MNPEKIRTREPFESLFPIDAKTQAAIYDDMKLNGFDPAHPLITWKGIVVDGHTRLQIAQELAIADVPVVEKSFEDEDAALEYAINCQAHRRNLSDSAFLKLVEEIRQRRPAHRPHQLTVSRDTVNPERERERIARITGASQSKVARAIRVLDHAPDDVKEAVLSGKMSVNAAHQETRAHPSRPDGESPDRRDVSKDSQDSSPDMNEPNGPLQKSTEQFGGPGEGYRAARDEEHRGRMLFWIHKSPPMGSTEIIVEETVALLDFLSSNRNLERFDWAVLTIETALKRLLPRDSE